MRYVSARGRVAELGFCDALLAGLATDGGLYVPQTWPKQPKMTSSIYHSCSSATKSPSLLVLKTLLSGFRLLHRTHRSNNILPISRLNC